MNKPAIWFRRVVILGILANFFFAIPGVFDANKVIGLVGIPPARYDVWPAFSCFLLFLLSLFYIPAALDPFKYRAVAWLTVLARLGGVWFFLIFRQEHAVFGYMDLFFFVTEGALLILAYRQGEPRESAI